MTHICPDENCVVCGSRLVPPEIASGFRVPEGGLHLPEVRTTLPMDERKSAKAYAAGPGGAARRSRQERRLKERTVSSGTSVVTGLVCRLTMWHRHSQGVAGCLVLLVARNPVGSSGLTNAPKPSDVAASLRRS